MSALSVVEAALRLIAAVAPGVLGAITSGARTDAEAISIALDQAKQLPVRGAAWEALDAMQDARIRGEGEE